MGFRVGFDEAEVGDVADDVLPPEEAVDEDDVDCTV